MRQQDYFSIIICLRYKINFIIRFTYFIYFGTWNPLLFITDRASYTWYVTPYTWFAGLANPLDKCLFFFSFFLSNVKCQQSAFAYFVDFAYIYLYVWLWYFSRLVPDSWKATALPDSQRERSELRLPRVSSHLCKVSPDSTSWAWTNRPRNAMISTHEFTLLSHSDPCFPSFTFLRVILVMKKVASPKYNILWCSN